MQWVLDRLSEKSTWLGFLTTGLGAAGVQLSPDLSASIAAAGTAVVGVILVIIKEGKKAA